MLEGSLETFPLTSVVRLLEDAGQTGRLAVHAALGQGALTFEQGRLVDAAGPGTDPLEAALALFEYHTGTFTFRVEAVHDRNLDVDISEFIELVHEREAAWAEIRRTIPQDGPLFVVPLEATDRPDGEITISNEAWRIAIVANGRTPSQIATLTGSTEFRVCSVLLELHAAGLIGFNANTQAARAPRAAATQEQPERPRAKAAPAPVQAEEQDEVEAQAEEDLDPEALLRELGEEPAPRKRLSRR